MSITVNGVRVDPTGAPSPELAALRELLRQEAVARDLVADAADADAVETAIERLLKTEVEVPEPEPEECARYYAAHAARYRSGDLVHARHILFQVTADTPIDALAKYATAMLMELRHNPDVFAERARAKSNCPSGAQGGNLGQLQRGATVPEFEQALFEGEDIGVLPQLVKTRFGFHIVAVDRRIPGEQLPFDAVAGRVATDLRRASEARALLQYARLLAGQAEIEGIELDAAGSPLVQ